jgi:DNA polymerase III sliding clamp (beta) subunit (PCNA family)
MATAYNDTVGIMVGIEWDQDDMCIPGELLVKALSGFKGDAYTASTVNEADVVIASGRSKIKLHTLPTKDFPFKLPDQRKVPNISLTNSMLAGIERCLDGVGRDLTHPEQMGVTLDAQQGNAVLYATDNYTISRYGTKDAIELPGDTPIIMPTAFCENLLAVSKAYPEDEIDLYMHADALVAYVGKRARVFSKVLADLQPMDFERVIGRHIKLDKLEEQTCEVPEGFSAALDRALLVLSMVADKATRVTSAGEVIKLHSASDLGDADDTLAVGEEISLPEAVHIDPALVTRGLKGCALMGFLDRALVLASADRAYLHLISYVAV